MGGVASIPTDPTRKVQVISAGWSRTGTVSMSLALDKLLDGPICHGGAQILVRDDDYCSIWIKAYAAREAGDKEETLKLVRKATQGFVGTADLPPADFIPEMLELYPEAKVVLVRRDAAKWWNSIATLTSRTTPIWLGPVLSPKVLLKVLQVWLGILVGIGGTFCTGMWLWRKFGCPSRKTEHVLGL